ncbi:hypothetical protein BDQ17DRAFT_1344188 [Cyathus striatus]|nr:hypothetical protein BDQ17DRAFT_1344188 [Cyathus striatus]
MWCCWGLKPAAYAVIGLEHALKLIGIRAALIRKNCTTPPSKMASLHLPLSKVRVELACINSDTHVTLAGTDQDLLEFRNRTLMMYPNNHFGSAVKHYRQYLNSSTDLPDWLEIGPHSTTIGFVPLSGTQHKYPSHIVGSSGWNTVMKTLTSLCNDGHDINFHSFHQDVNPFGHHVDLPRYPLNPQPHVYPNRVDNPSTISIAQISSSDIMNLMQGHMVAGQSICPASVYISMAFVAINNRLHHSAYCISLLKMTCPFSAVGDAILEVCPISSSSAYEIRSLSGTLHACLQIHCTEEARLLETLQLLSSLVIPFRSLMNCSSTNVLDGRLVYGLLGQVVQYGPQFQGLRRVWIAENGCQGWGSISNNAHDFHSRNESEPAGLRSVSPILIDLMYQLLGFLVNTSSARESGEIFVATEISDIDIAWGAVRSSQSFECYASFELHDTPKSRNGVAIGQVFTFDHSKRLVAVFRVIAESSGRLSSTISPMHDSPLQKVLKP